MKYILINILLFYSLGSAVPMVPCDSTKLDDFGSDLVECDEDSFKIWRSVYQQNDLVCKALGAYEIRSKQKVRILIGMFCITGPAFTIALGLTMGSDGQGPEYSAKTERPAEIALIIMAVNTVLWMPFFLKYALIKSPEEKHLETFYKSTQINPNTMSHKYDLFTFKVDF